MTPKEKKWLIQSIILLVVGIVLEAIVWVVYVPRVVAFQEAVNAWMKSSLNSTHGSPYPTFPPAAFGLDTTASIISLVLSGAGSILIFLGSAFIVILIIGKALNQTSKLP